MVGIVKLYLGFVWFFMISSHPAEINGLLKTKVVGAEKSLYNYLMNGYDRHVRPVINPNHTVTVNVSVRFMQLFDLKWNDEYLVWDPREFEGIEKIYLPSESIWLPDIAVANSVGDLSESPFMNTFLELDHHGSVNWFPVAKMETSCQLDVTFFPFDYQTCILRIGSWTHPVHRIDVQDGGFSGIEKADFIDNGELELLEVSAERQEIIYGCCLEPIVTLTIKILFKRRPIFILFTLAIPCALLSLLTVISFILTPDNSTKIDIQLSVILSLAVFTLLVGDHLPPSNTRIPLIEIHVITAMAAAAFALVCSVLVLRMVDISDNTPSAPLQKVVLGLARVICIQAPDHLKHATNVDVPGDDRITDGNSDHDRTTPDRLLKERSLSLSDLNKSDAFNQHADLAKLVTEIAGDMSVIVKQIRDDQLREERRSEWLFLGAVVDRILLITLLLVISLSTIALYVVYPLFEI